MKFLEDDMGLMKRKTTLAAAALVFLLAILAGCTLEGESPLGGSFANELRGSWVQDGSNKWIIAATTITIDSNSSSNGYSSSYYHFNTPLSGYSLGGKMYVTQKSGVMDSGTKYEILPITTGVNAGKRMLVWNTGGSEHKYISAD
jgi:hypothetical protein